jgi:hypothetical protein
MSEKINELIKSVKDLKYDSSTGTFETDRRALFEFAELIVRECIEIAYAYDAPKLSGPGMIVANRIEEHFGVEE